MFVREMITNCLLSCYNLAYITSRDQYVIVSFHAGVTMETLNTKTLMLCLNTMQLLSIDKKTQQETFTIEKITMIKTVQHYIASHSSHIRVVEATIAY